MPTTIGTTHPGLTPAHEGQPNAYRARLDRLSQLDHCDSAANRGSNHAVNRLAQKDDPGDLKDIAAIQKRDSTGRAIGLGKLLAKGLSICPKKSALR